MKKKLILMLGLIATVGMLNGCGSNEASSVNQDDTANEIQQDITNDNADKEDNEEKDTNESIDDTKEEKEEDNNNFNDESVVSGESSDSIELGRITGTVYENDYTKIGCDLGPTWTYYDEDMILQTNNMTKSMVGDDYKKYLENRSYIVDMMATADNQVDTININIQKINPIQNLATVNDMLEASKEEVKNAIESMGASNLSVEITSEEFMGEDCDELNITAEMVGHKVYEKLFAIKCKDYIVMITMAQWDNDDFTKTKSCFYRIED